MSTTPGAPARPSAAVHLTGWLVTATTLGLTVAVGALVTTHDAGMAFRDWPSSDGYNLLLYPWLRSTGAKFLEHGHRLAGTLVGCLSILLALVVHRGDRRGWVRGLGWSVLAAVVAQGILGGQRVLQDQRTLALLHGIGAALVVGLMGLSTLVTSAAWQAPQLNPEVRHPRTYARQLRLACVVAGLACGLVLVQYVLGGLLRHQGLALYEHLGFAGLVLVGSIGTTLCAERTGTPWLRRAAYVFLLAVLVQLGLGIGAFVTKFGFGNYVAVANSLPQVTFRTVHVLGGMLTWLAALNTAARAARLWHVASRGLPQSPSSALTMVGPGLAGEGV